MASFTPVDVVRLAAVSENMGSLGIEIGHTLAAWLGYQFAERDIISSAADRFDADVARLSHAVEERPARDDIVLVGLASTIILAGMPNTLRVRVSASEGAMGETGETRASTQRRRGSFRPGRGSGS